MQFFINFLTFIRILFAVFIFLLISFDVYLLLAFVLFILAGISDFFDGFLARKYNRTSVIGEILDPIADKVLIIFIFIAISVYFKSYLIGFLSSLIISREILVAALRDYNSRIGNSKATKVTFLAKIKTTLQLFTASMYLFALAFSVKLLLPIADIALLISTFITLYTGIQYLIHSMNND